MGLFAGGCDWWFVWFGCGFWVFRLLLILAGWLIAMRFGGVLFTLVVYCFLLVGFGLDVIGLVVFCCSVVLCLLSSRQGLVW